MKLIIEEKLFHQIAMEQKREKEAAIVCLFFHHLQFSVCLFVFSPLTIFGALKV